MVYITPAGAAPDVFNRGLEYLFYAANAVAADQYRYLGEYMAALPEDERPQTAAYAGLDDPFAQATGQGLKAYLEEAGVETVFETVYPPDTTDYSIIAAQIADADADVVVGSTIFEDSVGLVRALQELGYQPDMAVFTVGPTLPQFPEAVGGAVDGILSNVAWSSEADFGDNQAFVAAFEEMFGEEANEDAAKAYVVGELIGAAVEAVGCVDNSPECQTAVRDHIRNNETTTIIGPISFDEVGRPQAADMIQQWQDGEIEIVLPADSPVQTSELIYPKPDW
jgi:branched-chain amino acid transport system substrate-binding protein